VVLSLDGKEIGSIKSAKSGWVVNYMVNMALDLDTTNLILDWSGAYSEERWEQSVLLPTLFELLDSSHTTE
jgi:hypothetical protein